MAWQKISGLYEHAVKKGARRGIPDEFRKAWSGYETLRVTYQALSGDERGIVRLYALADGGHRASCLAEITFACGTSGELSGIARRVIQTNEFVHHVMSLAEPDSRPIIMRFVCD